ncbi:MAG: type II toxin-antitoxin system death-on-curing family toxin [Terracidiphilus sp.]|jgi:death-on-curing protein
MTNNHQPWTQWVGGESIEKLYAEGIKRWGGAGSAPQQGCIDAALGAAYSAELYSPESLEEGAIEGLLFACFLLFYLATKHCYMDGNKRIAWACMTFVILNFGLTIEATEDEVVEFCQSIARGEVKSGMAVTEWVYPRLKSII